MKYHHSPILSFLICAMVFFFSCKKDVPVGTNDPNPNPNPNYNGQQFYVMNGLGGENNLGYIYRINDDGSGYKKIYSFNKKTGYPALSTISSTGGKWQKWTDGKYYGVGYEIPDSLRIPLNSSKQACIYRFDPVTEEYEVLKYLRYDSTAARDAQFCLGIDNKLYLMGRRVLEYNPLTNSLTLLTTADWDYYYNTGPRPVMAYSGTIYSTYRNGNTLQNQFGGLAKYKPGDPFIKPLLLVNDSTGGFNIHEWITASDSCFYTPAKGGGRYRSGCIVKLNPKNDTITRVFDFQKDVTGWNPLTTLINVGESRFYGFAQNKNDKMFVYSFDYKSKAYTTEGTLSDNLTSISSSPYYDGSNSIFFTAYSGVNSLFIRLYRYDINTRIFTKLSEFEEGGSHGAKTLNPRF